VSSSRFRLLVNRVLFSSKLGGIILKSVEIRAQTLSRTPERSYLARSPNRVKREKMKGKNVKNGYDEFYETKFTNMDDWSKSPVVWHPRRWIASLAEKEKGQSLAIGCGMVDLKILQSDEKEIIGIDISKVALRTARNFGEVILADGTLLPFRDSSFDSICAFDVLEHVTNKTRMMIEIKRTLRTGGKMFLSVPIKTKGFAKDERQPLDDPPTLGFLIGLVKKEFHLSIIRGFWGRNPANRIPYSLYSFLSLFFKYFPCLLIGSRQISLVAIK